MVEKFWNLKDWKRKKVFSMFPFNSKGYEVVENKLETKQKHASVTVITPVYNAERYLRKTIDSVINQSIGITNIDYFLIDDCSTDTSRDIILEYTSKYENIFGVFLKENTGTPAHPRNIGLELSQSQYITFLDADDWLEPNGLEVLMNILEETGDDYVVGKTIQVQADGIRIVGEHESCKERRSVSPFSIPHIFHHLGPRARMIKTGVIKENQIKFPKMKFAEDKHFFIDVLACCKTISTTKSPIYYLNRMDNQKTRLSNQTNIIQKTNCNLKVIKHVLDKNLEIEKQKMVLNRLYEFDSIERYFTTPHFQRTKLKRLYYYKFSQILKTTKKLQYDFSENFFHPFNNTVHQLYKHGKYKDLEKLYEWNKHERVKSVVIQDGIPYMVAPFLEEHLRYIKLPMYAVLKEESIQQGKCCIKFLVYGEHIGAITDVLIRDTKNAFQEKSLPVVVDREGKGSLELEFASLDHLLPSTYSIYLRYNDYLKINIRKHLEEKIHHKNLSREYTIFKTVYSNIGLKIGYSS